METIRCTVEGVTFYNSDNDYAVVRVKTEPHGISHIVVGTLSKFCPGVRLEVEGVFHNDPRYGEQFAASAWREIMPVNVRGIERYLASGYIKGIGRATAKAIVKRFGRDTIDILDNDIDRLAEVPGLGKTRIKAVREGWGARKAEREIFIGLQGYGISSSYASKIYRIYGRDAMSAVKDNPYRLADDIDGIGFKTADAIASGMGYGVNDSRRIGAGVLFTLRRYADDGHVFAPFEALVADTAALLGVAGQEVAEAVTSLAVDKKVVMEDTAVYLPMYWYAERGAARRMLDIIGSRCKPAKLSSPGHAPEGLVYDKVQLEAIDKAVESKVMVLTGGPGTGKTTAVKGIIAAFKARKMKILLAAPTGRAAKRMSEATGMEARTIHRLLEYNPTGGFGRDAENPLDGDALIVDECSMIDILLFYSLLKAVPQHMRVIMVGDIDQLPSVGAGNVLRDVIASGKVPVVRLTHIFRQAMTSRIVTNAHAINAGLQPDLSNGLDSDFFFISVPDTDIAATIVDLVGGRLPGAYHIQAKEIQVLTPMYKGEIGASALNDALRQAVNPRGNELRRGDAVYRVGDKVMQVKNNYDKNIFNGDIGFIDAIDASREKLEVRYDNRIVEYTYSELDALMAAYAITIHKSQGSEFPILVIPVTMKHFVMLQRNLIYTAVTRAKQVCVMVGDRRALAYAVDNQRISSRNTRLAKRLAAENN